MILLDGLGEWLTLGTVTPEYFQWAQFPISSNKGFSVFRFSYSGDIEEIKKYVYSPIKLSVRPVYQYGSNKVVGQGIRLYPQQESKIITIPFPEELRFQQISRTLEITKYSKYWNNSSINSINLQVTCEEFSPYPENLALAQRAYLDETTIDQIAQAVINYLPPIDP